MRNGYTLRNAFNFTRNRFIISKVYYLYVNKLFVVTVVECEIMKTIRNRVSFLFTNIFKKKIEFFVPSAWKIVFKNVLIIKYDVYVK